MSYVVIQHQHDTVREVYELIIGQPVMTTPAPTDDDPSPAAVVAGYDNMRDFLWDANDPRWLDGNSQRRPESDVATEQRQEAIAALMPSDAPVDPDPDSVVELPGVGEPLT